MGSTISENIVQKFLKEIEKNCLTQIGLRKLIAPDGYAEKLVLELRGKFNMTQLRKFFSEIKYISELGKKGNENSAVVKIWTLYPKIAYASARGLIPKEMEKIFTKTLQSVEKCVEQAKKLEKEEDRKKTIRDTFETLDNFFSALVAYAKKYGKAN
jgi:CRISPR type III-A-associated protein Csm2